MIWQRRARFIAVAVAVTVSAAVLVTTQRRVPPPAPPAVPRVDPSAVVESAGAFVRDVKGAKERFRVEAKRQLTYSGGRTKLMDVRVSVDRDGKTFVLSGDSAQVGENQSSVQLEGHVHLTGSDGLIVDTDSATYNEGEGIVRAPGKVTFSRSTMTGEGQGFTYDRDRDAIGLTDHSVIKVAPDKKDTAGADITAGAALLARKDHFMSFERDVHIIRGSQDIHADRAVADLTNDEKHITALDLNGSARIAKSNVTTGGVKGMAANNVKMNYADNSELIQRAALAGSSSVTLAGDAKGDPDKTLAGDSIDIGLAPDGATVTSLAAHDKVSLDLPAPKGQPSKSIRSAALSATGEPDKGLTAAVFSDGVEYREFGGSPAVQRLVRSKNLDAALKNGFAEISDARFTGNVQFNDGGTRAAAATVRYQAASGSVDLTGSIGNAPPHVVNDQVDVSAGHVEMTLDGPKMTATEGPVKTVLKPSKAGTDKDATKMPGLMEQDRPVSGSSDKLVYDGSNGSKAEFTGAARVFQGDTVVQAAKISVDGHTGNLQAEGGVKSTLIINDTDPETKKPTPSRAIGAGTTMQYEDAERRVTYTTNAHVTGPQGDIVASSIALTLAKESQDVERMVADGSVTLKESGRVTTGDKLVYVAKDESYTMSGKVAKMVEASCRQNTGTILRFEKSTDKLYIDGADESRMQSTKAAPGCIPRPD